LHRHQVAESGDTPLVEGGLRQTTLAPPEIAVAGEKPVAQD
jgi:hypothetical protein